jgi:hypothetical protein
MRCSRWRKIDPLGGQSWPRRQLAPEPPEAARPDARSSPPLQRVQALALVVLRQYEGAHLRAKNGHRCRWAVALRSSRRLASARAHGDSKAPARSAPTPASGTASQPLNCDLWVSRIYRRGETVRPLSTTPCKDWGQFGSSGRYLTRERSPGPATLTRGFASPRDATCLHKFIALDRSTLWTSHNIYNINPSRLFAAMDYGQTLNEL